MSTRPAGSIGEVGMGEMPPFLRVSMFAAGPDGLDGCASGDAEPGSAAGSDGTTLAGEPYQAGSPPSS